MDNNKTLFIGNGLNQLNESSISWEKLLKELSGTGESIEIPYPLYFEKIQYSSKWWKNNSLFENSRLIKEEIRDKIMRKSNDYKGNDIISKFVSRSEYSDILTTNYDYNIELALNKNFLEKKKDLCLYNREFIYSFRRGYRVGDKNVWHIHGECDKEMDKSVESSKKHYPSESILIGFDHYAQYLQKIIEKYKANDKGVSVSNGVTYNDIWISQIFNRDIDIIGFSLDTTEYHLWWLLGKRAELIKERKIKKNVIRFFDIVNEKKNTNFLGELATFKEYFIPKFLKQRYEFLEELKVEVILVDVKQSEYVKAYEDIYKKL